MNAQQATTLSAAVIATLCILTGCSKSSEDHGTKEYAIPKTMCGTPVKSDLISQFLPPGNKIEVKTKNPVPDTIESCQVKIDGKISLMASQEWWAKEDAATHVPIAYPQLKGATPKDHGDLFYTGSGAARRVKPCLNTDHTGHVLYAVIQVYASSVKKDASTMKKLIVDYSQEVAHSKKCNAS